MLVLKVHGASEIEEKHVIKSEKKKNLPPKKKLETYRKPLSQLTAKLKNLAHLLNAGSVAVERHHLRAPF